MSDKFNESVREQIEFPLEASQSQRRRRRAAAPAAFSDAERNAFRFGYEQRGRDRNNHTYNPNRTDADIDVAMLAAGLTPAATPERQDAMTALRSIEAMLGTLDHSEAVEEDCLVKHVTAKVAELVNRERELPTDAIDVLALALFGEDYFREHRDSCRAEFLLDAGGAAQIIGRLRASSGGYNGGGCAALGDDQRFSPASDECLQHEKHR